ncbi:MAG: energy transducer TonB, partial [Exilibacterium sp.]
RFCALPDGRLETQNSGSYSAHDPKRVQILAANKSTSTDSQSEIPHSTLKPQPKRNVVSSTLEAEKKSTTEKLTAKQEETRRRYRSKIWELVLRYLEYPQRAQRRGQEGTVRLSVVIDRSGRIIKLVFLEQSQYHLLNQAVTRAAKRANPFPPVPEELEGGEFNFNMPFTFHVK